MFEDSALKSGNTKAIMHELIIRHIPETIPPQFQLEKNGVKTTEPVILPSPFEFRIRDIPNTSLMKGLRWYLERFLDYPFHPETDHVNYVLNALKDWGQKVFSSLSLVNHIQPDLRIACNDPLILNWPWEAITDEQGEFIAQTCQINRQIMNAASPAHTWKSASQPDQYPAHNSPPQKERPAIQIHIPAPAGIDRTP